MHCITLLCLATTTLAAPPAGDWTNGTAAFRQYPTVSGDGAFVVYSDRGDLWSAPIEGGSATRLTTHPADELRSALSPDGSTLVFESKRNGSTNLYTMPVARTDGRLVPAGGITRLTTSDRSQGLSGVSPDGAHVYFTSTHEPAIYRAPRMYSVPIDGGPMQRLTDAQGGEPRLHPDGRTLTFTRGYAPWARPAYRGSGAREVWALDTSTGDFRRITDSDSNEGQTFGRPDGSMVLVSSRDGQNNIWRIPKNATLHNGKQLTQFAPDEGDTIGHGVRDLAVSADGSTAVFAVWDKLYSLNLNKHKPTPKAIQVSNAGDHTTLDTRRQSLARTVTDAALHPSGDAMAIVSRGELFVRSTDTDYPARRLTDDHDRQTDVAWSADGRTLLYATDVNGRMEIHEATVSLHRDELEPEAADDEAEEATKDEAKDDKGDEAKADDAADTKADAKAGTRPDTKVDKPKKAAPKKNETGDHWSKALRVTHAPLVQGDFDAIAPMPSPDGRSLLYTRDRGDLVLRDLATGDDTLLLASWSQPEVVWLPDSRHIVYAVEDLDFNADVWLMDVTRPDEAVNLTRHPDLDVSPQISDDGKFMVFLSDRGRIGHNYEFDVYGMAIDPALLDMSEWERESYLSDLGKQVGAKKMAPLSPDEGEDAAKREAVDPIEFTDLDTAWQRTQQITSLDGSEGDLYLTPDGKTVLFSGSVDGKRGMWTTDWKGKGRKGGLSSTVSSITPMANGKKLAIVQSGQAKSMSPTATSAKTHAVDASATIDIAAEQQQKFRETARLFGRDFYHPTLKGLDWDQLTARYGDLAARTRTSQAFNRVVNEFFGEVNGSHTGAWGGFSPTGGGSTSLGYLGIETAPAPGGWQVTRVLADGPADRDKGLNAGDVITAINDVPVAADATTPPHVDLGAALERTAGTETMVSVRNGDDERIVLLTPTSYGGWRALSREDELAHRRRVVDKASDGRLGYLHIAGMNMPSVHEFERDLYAAAHGKDGLLIDVRDNGGGFTTDILLTSLTAPVHAYTWPRGADLSKVTPDTYPRDRRLLYAYSRPIAVLCNENSFSNAEIFSHAIQTAGRGPVIGTETFGGVISTGAFTLIDGTTIRRPFRGWYLPDGTDMESRGAIPDVIVERTPAHEAAGHDEQLHAAVDRLLRDLPSRTPTVDPKPAS